MASQRKHGVHQKRGAVFCPSPGLGWWFAEEKVAIEQALGQCCEVGIVPGEIHVDEVHYQLMVVGDFGPGCDRVGLLLIMLSLHVCMRGAAEACIQKDEVRGAANEAHRPILQVQFAHSPTQLFLEPRYADQRLVTCDGRLQLVDIVLEGRTLGNDGLGNIVQALARPDLTNQVGYFMLGIVENGLDERLEGGVVRLEIVNVFLVDALSSMIGVGIVDTFGAVD